MNDRVRCSSCLRDITDEDQYWAVPNSFGMNASGLWCGECRQEYTERLEYDNYHAYDALQGGLYNE